MSQVPVDLDAIIAALEAEAEPAVQVGPTTPAESAQAHTAVEDLDVSQTVYALHAQLDDGWATVPCSGLGWEEQTNELGARITATFPDDVLEDGRRLAALIQLGTPISVTAAMGNAPEYTEVVRGIIEEKSPNDGTGGTFEVIAYDPIKVMLKSQVDRFYEAGMTAAAIINSICAESGVEVDLHPALDSITFPYAIMFPHQSIADIVLKTIKEAQSFRDPAEDRLVVRTKGGRLTVVLIGSNKPIYWLDQGAIDRPGNLTNIRERFSITDLITAVRVVGKSGEVAEPPEVVTLTAKDLKFGTRTEIIPLTEHQTPDQVRVKAQTLLNEKGRPRHDRSLTAPDIPVMRKYDQIRVTAGTLDGHYVVESISHDERSRLMTISLGNLKFADVESEFGLMNEDAIPLEQTGGGGLVGGKVTPEQLYALALAAGFTGENAVIAVAISMAENSSGDPSVHSKPNDNKTIDLGLWQINSIHWPNYGGETNLMIPLENAKAAYGIWKAAGGSWQPWATYPTHYVKNMDRARAAAAAPRVPVPTASAVFTQKGASGLPNSAIIGEMEKWRNVPYHFGGRSKAGVDCSGFTQAVFKGVGVNLPNTAQGQYNATARVSQPAFGDLVFFKNTYPSPDQITHVGIYLGNGQMMSATDPHVKEDSINSPGWKSHLAGYGRVSA